jgi:hypothetical protein
MALLYVFEWSVCMPFFFYSQIDSDVAAQKNQDRKDINRAVQGTALSADNKQKLQDFLESVEELYHLFNREYKYPASNLNNILHDLSVEARNRIDTDDEVRAEAWDQLSRLNLYLAQYKQENNLPREYITGGIITAIALIGCLASVVLFPATASLFLWLDVLLAAVSSYTAIYFVEKSIDTYHLEQNYQLNNIQSFFGARPAVKELDKEFIAVLDGAAEFVI